MVIYVDIDETICNTHESRDYSLSIPMNNRIEKINNLYDQGHTIVYWTARGSTSGLDWTDLTTSQLSQWGAKYHEVKLGKPHYDLFIDDKNVQADEFFKRGNSSKICR